MTTTDDLKLLLTSRFDALSKEMKDITTAISACNSNITELQKLVKSQEEVVRDHGTQLSSLSSEFVTIKAENSTLNKRIEVLESNQLKIDSISHEVQDRLSRSKNIIIFGLDSVPGDSSLQKLQNILSTLKLDNI